MRQNRKNNRTIDLYRVNNTYVLNLFSEFGFVPSNMHHFLDL